MSRGVFITTCVLLAVTTHAQAQYVAVDFFNSFLQPFTTTKPRNEVTKRPDTRHRQTTKQKYQDAIFFETDDFLKQRESARTLDPFNIYPTTAKPRRKSKTTTTSRTTSRSITTNKPKSVNSNKIINNNRNHDVIRSISNGDNKVERVVNNGRRIDNYNNGYDNVYNTYNLYETTKPPIIYDRQTTNYFNGKTTPKTDYGQTTRRYPNERPYNRQTTKNPLLNRPGVKPAAVDENRPPITNRPVTQRPGFDQSGTYRAPVNTRPPFEAERPISTGVVRPVVGVTANEDAEIDIELGPDEEEMGDAEKRRLYDICEQKCAEFKSMRVRKVVALPLGGAGPRGAELNVSSCAMENVPLIIGGQLARIETFPHMALLGWKLLQSEGYAWKCGGSLISEQYVLTAGHCTYHDKDYNVVSGPPGAVQLGSAVYNDRTATVVRVSLVVRHPKYKLRRSYHDVALLKLAVQVTFSETISPACLGEPPAVGEPVIATGWGKTEFGGDSSIQLRSVSIPVWDMADCRDIWGTSLKLPSGPMPDSQICAGERKGNKDTCQGDSGGPAQVRDGCSWRVVAVTSVGRSCGARDTPALYARVPRAFVARQVYTNIKTGRDGNNQYGNQGTSVNNAGSGNNNNAAGSNWNTGTNNNAAGNNWNTVTNINAAGNNWNSVTSINAAGNNWNPGTTNNAAGNNWITGTTNNAAGNNRNHGTTNNGAGINNWNTGTTSNAAGNNRNPGTTNNAAANNWNTGTTNNAAGNNRNPGSTNNAAGNNRNPGTTNNGAGINNWNTGSNNAASSNNWNTGTNNNAAANNNWNTASNNWNTGASNGGTLSNKNGVSTTRPLQNNNGQTYNNAGTPNNQYYGDSQGSSTDNRATVNNNNGNNYNLNNNNRNVYDQTYNNNGQTTTGYNQNNFAQNNYNNANFAQTGYNSQSQNRQTTEKTTVIRNYGTQNGYNDNGSGNNGYAINSSAGYSIYPSASRPWWTR